MANPETQERIETQYETFFEDIDLSQFRDQIDPNVKKLAKVFNYIKNEVACGDIKMKTYSFEIKVYFRNTDIEVTPYGLIFFYNECFDADLHWHWDDKKKLISIEFSRGSTDIEILFQGHFKLKTKGNVLILTLEPESKVFVFSL